jgi:hypothetical protein
VIEDEGWVKVTELRSMGLLLVLIWSEAVENVPLTLALDVVRLTERGASKEPGPIAPFDVTMPSELRAEKSPETVALEERIEVKSVTRGERVRIGLLEDSMERSLSWTLGSSRS